ncbi:MAG: type I secretion protein TolC, partial [Thiotrichales bacterium]
MEFKKLSFLALTACISITGANYTHAYTLDQAIANTLKTNPNISANKAKRYAADNKLRGSYAGYFPTVDATGFLGRENRNNSLTRNSSGGSKNLTKQDANITLSQMLFDGFATKHDVAEQNYRVAAAAEKVLASVQDVSLQAIETYIEVLRRQGLVALAKKNLTAHQKILQQIRKRTESGVGISSDLEQARSRMALARTNLMSEQANLRDAEASYTRIIGIVPADLVRPLAPKKVLPNTVDVALALAVENHPSLQLAKVEAQAAAAQHKNTKAVFLPKLNFELSGSHAKGAGGDTQKNNSFSAGISLKYNIFKGGADVAREQEASWDYETSKEVSRQVRREVEQNLKLAWNAFSTARAQLKYF